MTKQLAEPAELAAQIRHEYEHGVPVQKITEQRDRQAFEDWEDAAQPWQDGSVHD